MTYLEAATLGIVEGLTEFLPISSTGHLILAGKLLGLEDSSANKAFDVIIQSGAIFAVIWEYRKLLGKTCHGILRAKTESLHLFQLVLLAFLPAAVIGVLASKAIKSHLFGVMPVAIALVVGGLLMILTERVLKKSSHESLGQSFEGLSKMKALVIGFAQCFSLWPGTSRSMATILGGRFMGLSSKQAAEFSFLLAIPTIVGASVYDLFKSRQEIVSSDLDLTTLAIGLFFSFVTALVVIRAFLKFLTSHSLEIFGWYRIVVGGAFLMF